MSEFNFGRSFGRCVPLLAMFALLIMACPLAALADGTAVSIADTSAGQAGEITVDVEIAGVTDLGAADIWLRYDSSVVEVTSVADGDLGTITHGIDNPNGVTRMAWFSATGKTGDFVFASITLHAVGSGGDTSTLDLDVRTLVDINGDPVEHGVDDGSFAVTTEGPGQHGLTISSSAGGSVTTPGEGAFTYDAAEVVNLEASADAGYQFDEWTGDVSTVADVNASTTTITMDGDKSVRALFTEAAPGALPSPGGLSGRAMIGIVAAAVVGIAAIVFFVVRRRRRYD